MPDCGLEGLYMTGIDTSESHAPAVRVYAGSTSEADLLLSLQPFSAEMTIDQAWRKHPGTRQVFAQHHLPSCDGCAVRFDETIAEAAGAYGLELDVLLEELNALL